MEVQFSGFSGYQNRNAEGTVGPHGELFSRTTAGGVGCPPKFSACDVRQNAREPGGLEVFVVR